MMVNGVLLAWRIGVGSDTPMSLNRVPYPSAQPVYAAANYWRQRCLEDDRSLFADAPGSSLADAQVLLRDFVEQPDAGAGDFLSKLRGQLAGSGASEVQLAAELLFVHLLVARSDAVSGDRKRQIVRRTLSFAAGTFDLPNELGVVLDAGLVRPGQAFNTYRWRLFGYLIQVFAELKAIPAEQRAAVVTDPDRFVAALDRVDDQGAAIQRHALEHLLFPDDFPPIVSQDHRRAILAKWPEVHSPDGVSEPRRLAAIVRHLAGGSDRFVNLYRAPWVWQWNTPSVAWEAFAQWAALLSQAVDLDKVERDYKLAAAARAREARAALEQGKPEWPRLLATAFTKDNNLVSYRVHQPFLDWVKQHPDAAATALRQLWREPDVAAVDAFLQAVPDSAVHGSGARLSIAAFLLSAIDVTRLPQWRATPVDTGYRLAGFAKPEPSATDGERYDIFLSFLDLVIEAAGRAGVVVRDRLDAQGLAWTLTSGQPPEAWDTQLREAFTAWRSGKGTLPPQAQPQPEVTPDAPEVGDAGAGEDRDLADLARELYLDEPFLDEAVQLLRDKGQVIFYGPPGTGKTYVARALAGWLAGSASRVRLVQFHPSYAYEDFVEGLRPREDATGFHRIDGPLLEMANMAAADPTHDHVLIIDELNRGNVARVFGELYFLLEYRGHPARLLYSRQEFRLPANLRIIATMNTADRSIALLDSALRRRFYFIAFRPDEPPVSQVLSRYLAANHAALGWVADVVDRANTLLNDPDAAIGPSHFMRDDLDEAWVRRAWEHAVLPTLEEHFYGHPDRLAEFGLNQLRAEVSAPDEDSAAP